MERVVIESKGNLFTFSWFFPPHSDKGSDYGNISKAVDDGVCEFKC